MANMLDYTQIVGFVPPEICVKEFLEADTEKTGGTDRLSLKQGKDFPSSILLAYSGGADSSLLLSLLCSYCQKNGISLYAAHVNHGIRGAEAERDRDFCVKTAEKLGVKCFVLDTDIPSYAAKTGQSIETAAREVRYDFFADIMEKNGIKLLATAHNADDNLETVLFHLARGTGLAGLCGIPSSRRFGNGYIVRPILSVSKNEIFNLCREYEIPYVTDSTNNDVDYTRNRIRTLVVTELKKINPAICRSASRMCKLLRQDEALIDSMVEEILRREDCNSISVLKELAPSIQGRVFSKLYSRAFCNVDYHQLEHSHIEALSAFVSRGVAHSQLSLPSATAQIEQGRLVFFASAHQEDDEIQTPKNEEFYEIELCEGDNVLPGGFILTVNTVYSQQIQKDEENIYKLFTHIAVDSATIKGGLFAKNRRPGDKIRCNGMSKDVRKLFSAAHLSLEMRKNYPIVCDDDGVLWLPGIAHRDWPTSQCAEKYIELTLKKTN